jgi:membrane-bound ClpP family serine protease
VQTGKLVAGAVMMVIGASHIFGLASWWPLILVAVGIILLVTSLKKPTA